jgi:hypothetical protein
MGRVQKCFIVEDSEVLYGKSSEVLYSRRFMGAIWEDIQRCYMGEYLNVPQERNFVLYNLNIFCALPVFLLPFRRQPRNCVLPAGNLPRN